jgi:hypothetical protein
VRKRGKVRAALDNGGPMRVKAILQELTEEVRIDARDAIEPTFLIPAVRRRQVRWARQDSNLRPTDYESAALTI